ncbi:MAG TPA: hypothetical protein VJP58_00545 [Candidatus Nitrosocosmicus sp.]|nr:hypothetical protein [Candidatus Nitrosocosmicus sp.]
MLRAGEWLSIAVLGLVVLFIFNSIAFFTFLIGPEGTGPTTTVEPSTAYLQFIFMSLAPAIGLSFFTNVLSDGSRLSSLLVLVSGICLIFGMIYITTLIPMITEIDLPSWVIYAPWVFAGFGIIMVAMGYINYRKRVYVSTKNKEI